MTDARIRTLARAAPALLTVLIVIQIALPGPLAAQGGEYHGADSTFSAEGLALLWATLKAPREEDTLVYLKIVRTSAVSDPYRCFAVLAVDPFSGEIQEEVRAQLLGPEALAARPRPSFQEYPASRILFYTGVQGCGQGPPEMTVYFLGIPDTTPEFTDFGALEAYLAEALRRLGG